MKKPKKILPYLFNTILVISIFILTLIITKTIPFGTNTLGKGDAIVQYKPMLYNFIMSIKTNTLSSFSFNNGLGNPTLFNYLYYLASPLNLVAYFFNNADTMYLSTIIIKLIFTSLNVTFYSKSKSNSNLIACLATLSYTFCGWFLAYYYHLSWLDTFMIFPIFQYGLERLINNQSPLIFIFSLSYSYATNYYLSSSLLIYMLIYFIIKNFFYDEKPSSKKLQITLKFLISTLLSFLLITFYLYSLHYINTQINSEFASPQETTTYVTTTKDFFQSLFYGNTSDIISDDSTSFPNLGINTLILLSLINYFFNKNISKKDKLYTFISLDIIILFLFISPLASIIQGPNKITNYTYPTIFIPSFLSIMIFIENASHIDHHAISKNYFILPLLLLILILNYKTITFNIWIFNLSFLIIYTILTIFYNNTKYYHYLILATTITQVAIGCILNIPYDTDDELANQPHTFTTEKSPYRLTNLSKNTYFNENLYTNQDTLSLFTSKTYYQVNSLLSDLGCNTGDTVISCDDNDTLTKLLFNVEGKYQLAKIYAVNNTLKTTDTYEESVKETQSQIIKAMTNITDIFNTETLTSYQEDNAKYYFKTIHEYYLIDIQEDNTTYNYSQTYTDFNINKEYGSNTLTIYTLNQTKLEEIYNYLSKNQIEYTHYEDNYIEGTITVSENQLIFTSIPYDESWEILVDNQVVKPTKLLNSLIGIEVEPGTHTISLRYKTDYLKTPALISLITFISLCTYGIYKTIKNKKIKS